MHALALTFDAGVFRVRMKCADVYSRAVRIRMTRIPSRWARTLAKGTSVPKTFARFFARRHQTLVLCMIERYEMTKNVILEGDGLNSFARVRVDFLNFFSNARF